MALTLGIDPGIHGALAIYDGEAGRFVSIEDMPIWHMVVGKKTRARIDAVALVEKLEWAKTLGVELVVMEAVGGRPMQSASAGFVFGYTVGLIYMGCVNARLAVDTPVPATWKRLMHVPGKKGLSHKDSAGAIVGRADELCPDDRGLWRGVRGGISLDRAEAALLAMFGARHSLRSVHADTDWRLAYQKADTGS